jgi:hypothetical protein
MVAGTFRCLGSEQELKNTHGDGHELSIKLRNPTDADLAPLIAAMASVIDFTAQEETPSSGGDVIVTDGASKEEKRLVMRKDLGVACDALELLSAPRGAADSGSAVAFTPLSAPRQNDLLGVTGGDAVSSSAMLQAAALEDDGFLPIESLAAWWIKADWFASIDAFLATHFAQKELIEKHESIVRYRLPDAAKAGAVVAAAAAAAANADADADAAAAGVAATTPALIVLPASVADGAKISLTTPNGTVLQIEKPAGVAEGQVVQLPLPPAYMTTQFDAASAPAGLAQTFGLLERKKEALNVLEYSGACFLYMILCVCSLSFGLCNRRFIS